MSLPPELDELPLLLPEDDSLLWLLWLDALELDGHEVDELLPSLDDWLCELFELDELLFEFELLPLDPLDDGWLQELELPLLPEPEEELPLEPEEPLLDPDDPLLPLDPDEPDEPDEPQEPPLDELDELDEELPELLLDPPPPPELEPDELLELTMPIIATAPIATNKHSTNILYLSPCC